MKNKKILFAVLAIALVLGMTACPSDSGGGGTTNPPPNTDPKTITINVIPKANMDAIKANGAVIGLIPAGTDLSVYLGLGSIEEMMRAFNSLAEVVCYINKNEANASWLAALTNSLSDLKLFIPNTSEQWTGTGIFDVVFSDQAGQFPCIASSVNFFRASTTVPCTQFSPIVMP
jgi:hypothetical protein